MRKEIRVGISEYRVSKSPDKLITLGLGSCVGIAIYDKVKKVGGLSHIMLPDSTLFKGEKRPEKFADLAIPMMIEEITGGRNANGLLAKIAGGASMFSFSGNSGITIGQRNIESVLDILRELRIPIVGQDTGGKIGRTMIVNLDTFSISIRRGNKEIRTL